MPRYVLRPSTIMRTPRLLATAMASETRRYPSLRRGRFDPSRDFFLVYPPPSMIEGLSGQALQDYTKLQGFYSANKYDQRRIISGHTSRGLESGGIVTPVSYATHADAQSRGTGSDRSLSTRDSTVSPAPPSSTQLYIVRKLRHAQGKDYRVTSSILDFEEGKEYISELFPKTREYRIIYVFGEPLLILRKKAPEDLGPEQPWNHANGSFFQTVKNWKTCRLTPTGVIEKLREAFFIKHAHIVGVDVMLSKDGEYSVLECNACPSLLIEDNLHKVADYITHTCGR
jgi:hypothetical protein